MSNKSTCPSPPKASRASDKIAFRCSNNDFIYLSTDTSLAKEKDFIPKSYAADTLTVNLIRFSQKQVARYLWEKTEGRALSPDSAAIEALLSSPRAHYGMDFDTGHLEITRTEGTQEALDASRSFSVLNGDHEFSPHEDRPCTLVSHGACSLCPARLPSTSFPGLPYVCHRPGGMRVHLPRPEKKKKLEVKDKPLGEKKAKPAFSSTVSIPIDENGVSCCKCSATFKLKDVLAIVDHLSTVHGEKNLFVCPGCPGAGTYYYLPGTLRRHIASRHQDQDAKALEEGLMTQMTYMQLGNSKEEAKQENNELPKVSARKRKKKSLSDSWEQDNFVKSCRKKDKRGKREKKVKKAKSKTKKHPKKSCWICSKEFATSTECQWHERNQHFKSNPKNEVSTITCQGGMPKEFYQRVIYSGRSELVCLVCLRVFSKDKDLEGHWQSEHEGSKQSGNELFT